VGGTTVEDIAGIGNSSFALAIGGCMEAPALMLRERTGVEYKVFRGLTGLVDSEAFVETLTALSGRAVHEGLNRRILVLRDAMRDAYLHFGGKRVCLALEPSHAESLSRLLHEMGARTTLCVIPQKPSYKSDIWAERVVVGSLADIRGDFDLIISNSHAADTARGLGVPLYQAGFPVYKVFGAASKPTTGFRGTLSVLCDLTNIFMEVH
jgi:nitrogenase molybdenum-iron protein alpha/beta subunit